MRKAIVEQMAASEFEGKWRAIHELIFSGHDLDNNPFNKNTWCIKCIGAPSYYFEKTENEITDAQKKHSTLYRALDYSISQLGDNEIVGFLRDGPHKNPSIFLGRSPYGASMYRMRALAIDGFDLHIFSTSACWGLAVSWEEEVAVLGGTPRFMEALTGFYGSDRSIDDDFDRCAGYLEELSDVKRKYVERLRLQNRSC